VLPFVELATSLKDIDNQVVVLTNKSHCDRWQKLPIEFCSIDTVEEHNKYLKELPNSYTLHKLPDFFRCHYLPKVIDEYNLIINKCMKGQWVIITNHVPGIATRLAAETLQCPIFAGLTFPNHIVCSKLWFSLMNVKLRDELAEIRRQLSFPVNPEKEPWWSKTTGFIAFWPNWFFPCNIFLNQPVINLGFVLQKSQSNLKPEIQQFIIDEPYILITSGSANLAPKEFYGVVRQACENIGLRSLQLGVNLNAQCYRRSNYSLAVKWLENPSPIYKYASVVVHHGGMGTIGLASEHSVPQLVCPISGDRPWNGSNIQKLGLGTCLTSREFSIDRVAQEILELTNSRSKSISTTYDLLVRENLNFPIKKKLNDFIVELTTRKIASIQDINNSRHTRENATSSILDSRQRKILLKTLRETSKKHNTQ
jgi:hypothetical protein